MIRHVAVLLAAGSMMATAQDLMPVPSSLTRSEGALPIGTDFRVELTGYRDARLQGAADRLTARIARQTGMWIRGGAASATLVIDCKAASAKVQTLAEDESYTLEVSAKQARMSAATVVGAMRGMETFLQLVAPAGDGFAVPALRIEDKPRFRWRGLMIDSARHFQPIDVIERNIDAMAAVKLNVFHWHLSDNQGFRIESKVFPELHRQGSDGLFYTQAQIRGVIQYASDRGIRVVPEFDMPGHSTAWFVGYPKLASGAGPYKIEREWGVFDPAMDPTREETYAFLDKFIGEMVALFPDEYFHVGGDEVNGKEWDANPRIQEFKRAHNIKTNEELQGAFIKRVAALVVKHGKKVIGWDEVLDPTLPKDAVVQSWRGQKSLAEAARSGHQGILSSGYYLDLMLPAGQHYRVDPMEKETAGLSESEKALVLGGEACEWTEFASGENLEARIWPRMAAIAERFWSPQSTTDLDSMYRRLAIQSARLEIQGLRHRTSSATMLARIAGFAPSEAMVTLSTAVEPIKDYARVSGRKYTQYMPLNRMLDAAPSESMTARAFSRAVDALVSGDASKRAEVRRQGELWRDQHEQLKPVFAASFLAAEVEPVSADVAALGAAIVEAVDYLESGKSAPSTWADAQRQLFARTKEPRAELIIVIRDATQKLAAAVTK